MNAEQQPLHALPQGYRLEEYELLRVLGFGGFGMTYLGFDHHLDKGVAIKEYLPSDIATRTPRSQRCATSQRFQEDFEWGLDRFLDEARTLARFQHPNIVQVYRFFEAHGTGYIVMEYVERRDIIGVSRAQSDADRKRTEKHIVSDPRWPWRSCMAQIFYTATSSLTTSSSAMKTIRLYCWTLAQRVRQWVPAVVLLHQC